MFPTDSYVNIDDSISEVRGGKRKFRIDPIPLPAVDRVVGVEDWQRSTCGKQEQDYLASLIDGASTVV